MNDIVTQVVSNRQIAPGYHVMVLRAPGYLDVVQPGQFVMLRIGSGNDPLLRRPFGIFHCYDVDGGAVVELLYKVAGRGTAMMAAISAGAEVALLGPLGSGFAPVAARRQVLVAGGIGVAALYLLARQLREQEQQVELLLGGRSSDDIVAAAEFEALGVTVRCASEDGSCGHKGYVTDLLDGVDDAAVYACGPMPMLHAVARLCRRYDLPLQVSLEARMACGVGACLGCVVAGSGHSEQQPRYLCTCTSGPVFDAAALEWPEEGGAHE